MRAPARVLIVDDEPDMSWTLQKLLESEGYSIIATATASEALEILRCEPFDLIFLDAKLPDAEGTELCSEIKSIMADTAIFLLSGYFYLDDGTIQDLLERGLVDGFVGKPFDIGEVRSRIRGSLEGMGLQKV
ncbi:MAG: response regulator [Nitrospinota bacterium]